MKKRLLLLFCAALLPFVAQLFAYYVDSYTAGLIVRIISQVIIPVGSVAYLTGSSLIDSFLLPLHFQKNKRIFGIAVVCSIATIAIIVGALFIFYGFFDFQTIAQSLNYSLDKHTYFFVAL